MRWRSGEPDRLGSGEVQISDAGGGRSRGQHGLSAQVEAGRAGVRVAHENAGQPGKCLCETRLHSLPA